MDIILRLVEAARFSCFERISCSRIFGGSVHCCVLLDFCNSICNKIYLREYLYLVFPRVHLVLRVAVPLGSADSEDLITIVVFLIWIGTCTFDLQGEQGDFNSGVYHLFGAGNEFFFLRTSVIAHTHTIWYYIHVYVYMCICIYIYCK